MALEGELRVGLSLAGAQVQRLAITSTRPDVAQALLRGRLVGEVGAAVPLLFSICGRSQAAASQLACRAAQGELPDAESCAAAAANVAAETLRECAWHTLLNMPRWLGEPTAADALAAARGVSTPPGAAIGDAVAAAVANATFGMPAADWLQLVTAPAFDAWADAGTTAAARYMRRLREEAAADGSGATPRTPLLPAQPDAAFIAALGIDQRPGFAQAPDWQGAAAETGARARWQAQPLLQALAGRSVDGAEPRFAARLLELAQLLDDCAPPAVGVLARPDGHGTAWVQNARGLLIHDVQVEPRGDARPGATRVLGYRIVAPTEWNFHARGALAAELLGRPFADAAAARAAATRLVHSLDPCVACRVEIDDA